MHSYAFIKKTQTLTFEIVVMFYCCHLSTQPRRFSNLGPPYVESVKMQSQLADIFVRGVLRAHRPIVINQTRARLKKTFNLGRK